MLALLLGSLWLRSAWSTRFVALLVGALAVRCHLKPAEVERIIAIAGGCSPLRAVRGRRRPWARFGWSRQRPKHICVGSGGKAAACAGTPRQQMHERKLRWWGVFAREHLFLGVGCPAHAVA